MNYIDLHTHQLNKQNVFAIKNIFAQDYSKVLVNSLYSVGLHPWHIEKVDWVSCFEHIFEASNDKNMLFVGECGLDRSIDTTFVKQEECFKKQIEIASQLDKPLIIHCVRAYNDLIRIRKSIKLNIPLIIHGFNGNRETTLSLLTYGFYFSVGERFLFDERKNVNLELIPINHLFLETDESAFSIETMYQKASLILDLNEQELVLKVMENFKNILR